MKMKKMICAVLALITVVGAVFTGTVGVFAADDSSTDEEVKHTDYLAEAFKSPEEKIATMRLKKPGRIRSVYRRLQRRDRICENRHKQLPVLQPL